MQMPTFAQYEHWFNHLPVAVLYIDAKGIIIKANKVGLSLFDLSKDQIIGASLYSNEWTIFDEQGNKIPLSENPVRIALESGLSNGPQIIGLQRSGSQSKLWLRVSNTPFFSKEQVLGGVFSVLENITDMILAQRNYRLLFEEMMDGFALHETVLDSYGSVVDYRFLKVNNAFRRITGIGDLDIEGRTVLDVFPETELYWIETYGNVALTGKTVWFEHYSGALDKTFEVKAFSPEKYKFATLFTDISDRVNAERKLERAIKISERENASKGRFLANISHEIRTPINSILGAMALLEMTNLDEEQLEYVDLSKNSAKLLLSLLDHILDMAKLEAGTTKVHKTPVDIRELILECWSLMATKAKDKSIDFSMMLDDIFKESVLLDRKIMTQVLLNLLSNSVKFTSNGSIQVKVYFKKQDDLKCDSIVIEVHDSGIGMSEEFQELLFTPFLQNSSQNNIPGNGLGLSITKKLVDLTGGEIFINSNLGVGTVVTVKIPMERENAL